jgi:hypothetical protein
MKHPIPPPHDEDDDDDDDERPERSTLGKIAYGCFVVLVTGVVAVFLVFGLCVIAMS